LGISGKFIRIIEYQYEPEFSHSENINQEFKDEIAILYLSHICYDMMMDECKTADIFIDDYMEILDMQQKNCQIFYQNTIFPALLKHKKRLPERICSLLQDQARVVSSPHVHAF